MEVLLPLPHARKHEGRTRHARVTRFRLIDVATYADLPGVRLDDPRKGRVVETQFRTIPYGVEQGLKDSRVN